MNEDLPIPQAKRLHGRGASFNPANRFDKIEIEQDPDFLDEDDRPAIKTEFYKDTTKKIINFNDSPDISFSASVNPYRGCEHGCIYCFARPTHEYFGLSSGVDFETKIFVKEDAAPLLTKELGRPSWEPQPVVVGSATDPYQPVERKLKITRAILEVFLQFRNPLAIITKNSLVTRDIDLLKGLNEYQCCLVNVSITTLDRKLARVMEPRTATPENRLKAVEALAKEGIPVNVMVAPVIPGLNDHEIPRILKAAADAGACSAAYVVLRLPHTLKDLFEDWLTRHFPDRKNKILNRIRSMRGGKLYDAQFHKRMRGEGIFAEQIKQMFDVAYRKCGLDKRQRPTLSIEYFRSPAEKQLTLF
ncbi:MAG TPA: PA0069 family radical SAM protein [Candidatus Omnitrophota bacterium]|nr:PA0069 family radical SAM protein [Candidatus Omnitrophota bacterium]